MFRMIGTILIGLVVLGVSTSGRAQEIAAQKGAAPGGTTRPGGVQALPGAPDGPPTATRPNQTDKVHQAGVVGFPSPFPPPPPQGREIAYNKAMEILVNTHLLHHFLFAQRIQVPES